MYMYMYMCHVYMYVCWNWNWNMEYSKDYNISYIVIIPTNKQAVGVGVRLEKGSSYNIYIAVSGSG